MKENIPSYLVHDLKEVQRDYDRLNGWFGWYWIRWYRFKDWYALYIMHDAYWWVKRRRAKSDKKRQDIRTMDR